MFKIPSPTFSSSSLWEGEDLGRSPTLILLLPEEGGEVPQFPPPPSGRGRIKEGVGIFILNI